MCGNHVRKPISEQKRVRESALGVDSRTFTQAAEQGCQGYFLGFDLIQFLSEQENCGFMRRETRSFRLA
jgi:hypothetical protein